MLTVETATIFNIQKYSLFDGPGIRTVFFFKGCPLACRWCSNPESQSCEPEVAFEGRGCIGCKACVSHCPVCAISFEGQTLSINRTACNRCMDCAELCPTGAIAGYGKPYSVAGLIEIALRDAVFYRRSGGGVTLSGGEPLLNAAFAHSLLEACRTEGLDTAVETCGAVPWEVFSEASPLAGTIYFDLKHVDDEKHKTGTGHGTDTILSNLRRLSAIRDRLVIRFPLIPGFNARTEDVTAIADWISKNTPGLPLELMPYHRYGENKYAILGRIYMMDGTAVPSDSEIENALSIFRERGIQSTRLH